jgi:hypothetical protein
MFRFKAEAKIFLNNLKKVLEILFNVCYPKKAVT